MLEPSTNSWMIKTTALCSVLLSPSLMANVVGTDFQNFNPISSGLDFVTVQSSETLRPGLYNLGLFANYAVNPLPEFATEDKGRGGQRNSLTALDLNMGLGLSKIFDVGISFPFSAVQTVEDKNERIQYGSRGLNEVRLNSKIHLLGDASGGLGVVGTLNINTTEDNAFMSKNAGPMFSVELVADQSFGGVSLGVNAGFRKRQRGKKLDEVPVEPLGDQWLYSLAASTLASSIDTVFIGEVFGTQPAESKLGTQTKRYMTSTEILLGAKYLASDYLAYNLGVGTYIDKNAASPELRIYAGLNWSGELWAEAKTIVEKVEKAKEEPRPATAIVKEESSSQEPDVYRFDKIRFIFDSPNQVYKGSFDEIDQLVKVLSIQGFTQIVVEGHTDSLGNDQYNRELSVNRANTVKKYLVKNHKIDPLKISTIGFGAEKPIADNATFQGRKRNRRVEFKIYGSKKEGPLENVDASKEIK